MQTLKLLLATILGVILAVPFGCGKNDSDDDAASGNGGRAGSAGAAGGGGLGGRNSGGRTGNTSGSGPTGCEGLTPKNGEACTTRGIVCPSQLGSCVCQRSGWECFEVGGNEGGSGSIDQGGAGPGLGAGGAAGAGGEAGESLGGQAGAGGATAGGATAGGAGG